MIKRFVKVCLKLTTVFIANNRLFFTAKKDHKVTMHKCFSLPHITGVWAHCTTQE